MTIHSSTRKQNLTLNYKVCSNWKPYYIKVTANPKDTSRVEKFNVTVAKINFYNAVLELERIDEDSGWEDMLFTVQWTIYHISDYITSTATVQYRLDYDTDLSTSQTLSVSAVYGQGLSPLPALQNNPQLQPRLSHERQNGHRFLVYDKNSNCLVTDLDLNPKQGAKESFTVFIVYQLTSHTSDILLPWRGLFGHDNGGWDKFVAISAGTLHISGTIGSIQITSFPNNADPRALRVWNVISVQWNVDGGVDASSAWCNGKLLHRFQASTTEADTRFAIGAIDITGKAFFHGAIGEFVLIKDVITDDAMKKYHLHFIEKWGITA
ncbi:uncharacterized protein LOC108949892 [Ciona intestinalis]